MKKLLGAIALLMTTGLIATSGYVIYDYIKDRQESIPTSSQQQMTKQTNISFGEVAPNEPPEDIDFAMKNEKDKNKDAVGWLSIDDTNVCNPVLQSYNNSYYLRKNEKKEHDIFGCYFADYENNLSTRDKLSGNTVIYGHSDLKDNKDGKRFSQLFKFTDEEFAKKHNIIDFSLPTTKMKWEIFSVLYATKDFRYIDIYNKGSKELGDIIKKAKQLSIHDYDTQVSKDDNILILSTCTVKPGKDFFVVMAKLLP